MQSITLPEPSNLKSPQLTISIPIPIPRTQSFDDHIEEQYTLKCNNF